MAKTRLNRRRRSIKQKVWEFMCRNRQFSVSDIEVVFETDKHYLGPVFRAWELAGYIRLAASGKTFSDRVYRFVRCTGKWSPGIIKSKPWDKIHDFNTGETLILDGKSRPEINNKIALLKAMKPETSRAEVAITMGIPEESSIIMRYFKHFEQCGVLVKLTRRKNLRRYLVNQEKYSEQLRSLQKSS